MNESIATSQSKILTQHDAALLLGIAGRCGKGLTTVADAEVLEDLARQVATREGKQIHSQPAASTKRLYAQSSTLGEYGIIPECDTSPAVATVAHGPAESILIDGVAYTVLGPVTVDVRQTVAQELDESDDYKEGYGCGWNEARTWRREHGFKPPVAQEPVAWFTEDHLTDKSATTWDATVAERWRAKGWPVDPLYAAPALVSAQAQPWQSLAAAMYQAAGAYDMPVRFLDVLSAAANGEPFAHLIDGLLPIECPEVSAQDREDMRQREGQAVSDFMEQYADDDDPGHCMLDWCDSDNVDALLDVIYAARAAKGSGDA